MNPYENGPPDPDYCDHARVMPDSDDLRCLDCGEFVVRQGAAETATFQGKEITVTPSSLSEVVRSAAKLRDWFETRLPDGGKAYDKIEADRLKAEYEQLRVEWAITLPPDRAVYALQQKGDLPTPDRKCGHEIANVRYNEMRRGQYINTVYLERSCDACGLPLPALTLAIPRAVLRCFATEVCGDCGSSIDPSATGRAFCDPCYDARFSQSQDALSTGRRLRLLD